MENIEVENNQPTDEQIIDAGNECEALLTNETFNKVMGGLLDGAVRNFLQSEADGSDKRESAWAMSQALSEIVNTLKHHTTVRDQLLAKNEEEVTPEEE